VLMVCSVIPLLIYFDDAYLRSIVNTFSSSRLQQARGRSCLLEGIEGLPPTG
jgi:hypothetical protein